MAAIESPFRLALLLITGVFASAIAAVTPLLCLAAILALLEIVVLIFRFKHLAPRVITVFVAVIQAIVILVILLSG